MKRAAVQVSKICNDLRRLSSGPRCGLDEINLPPMQPGSSIMPGKVNPVIPELVSQICYQIIGYDVTIAMASEASELELNMAEPIIAYDLFTGLMFLRNVSRAFADFCIKGIKADRERCRQFVQNSIGIVTALNPAIGYEKSAAVRRGAGDGRQRLRPGAAEGLAHEGGPGRRALAREDDVAAPGGGGGAEARLIREPEPARGGVRRRCHAPP